jgi:hypothetical protein
VGPVGGSGPQEGSNTRSEPNTGLYGRSTPTVDEVYPRRARFPAWRTGVGRGSDAGACARASPPHLSFHSRVIPRVARDLHRPRTRRAAIGRLKEQGVEGTTGAPPVRPSPKSEGLCLLCSEFGNINHTDPAWSAGQQQQHRARGRSATPHSPVASSRFRHRGSAPVSGEGPLPAPASLWSVSVACFARASDLPVTLLSCGRRAVR